MSSLLISPRAAAIQHIIRSLATPSSIHQNVCARWLTRRRAVWINIVPFRIKANFTAVNSFSCISITKFVDGMKETGGDDENGIVSGSNNNTNCFPWRHEYLPTTRLLEKNDFSGMPNNFRARLVRRIVSCRELNISFLEAMPIPLFARTWEANLAENFKDAFVVALSELLSTMFHTPVKIDQGVISIDSVERNESLRANALDENVDYLSRMLDKKLLAVYQCVNIDNLRLQLSMRPVETTLEHIFTVPLLSREIVEKKPHLKGSFQKIENAFTQKAASYSEITAMTIDLAKEIGDADAYTRTVIADVTIKCLEFFQVKDVLSGAVLQGMEDEQDAEDVIHVVRFEVVTEKSEDGGRKVGSWKIIDFDDMLNGNVFH